MSEAKIGENNPFYGRIHSAETITKLSEIRTGKTHSEETKVKISIAGKEIAKTEEHKAKISKSMNKKVFVYSSSITPTILSHEFVSYTEAALYFNSSKRTLSNYVDKNKLFRKQWILSTSKIFSEKS